MTLEQTMRLDKYLAETAQCTRSEAKPCCKGAGDGSMEPSV